MAGKYITRTIKMVLVVVFICQLLSTVERQVFDFLGYMWAPIIGNFFQIIAVILGLFGAYQHYRSFVVVYAVWSLLWLGWNIFVICLYMEVGILNRNRERYILTIGTESKSWWLEHGIGCIITNTSWLGSPQQSAESSRPIPPEEFVEGCVLQYYYVEVIHAAVQVLLALMGLIVASLILHTYLDEEDASSPANDELEFVKIRNRATTNTNTNTRNTTNASTTNFDNLAFDSEDNDSLRRAYRLPPPGPRPYEQPPSYDTTMRNTSTEAETRAANLYYASDRQSVRSKASTRSKRSTTASGYQRGGNQASSRSRRSTRSRGRDHGSGPQDLPWVQITPSTSGSVTDGHLRHYP